jgi:hypothetical protein
VQIDALPERHRAQALNETSGVDAGVGRKLPRRRNESRR